MYLGDTLRAGMTLAALRDDAWEKVPQDPSLLETLLYTRKLTLEAHAVGEADIEALRSAGYCDKGISYLIQIASSFAYWSRMINGLGTVWRGRSGL